MNRKKPLLKKAIVGFLFSLFLSISGMATLILQPQIVFANELEYKSFTVYANSAIDEGIKPFLDASIDLVKESELFDADYHYDIFLSHQTFFNKVDEFLIDQWAAARAIDNNIVIKVEVDFEKGLAYTEKSKIGLSYMIAHEMIHCLQAHKYGKMKFNPFKHPPMWKLEGYPEYYSRQDHLNATSYDLKQEVERFIQLEAVAENGWIEVVPQHFVPVIYYKSRLMTEYLLDVKGQPYDDLLKEEVKEAEVWAALMEWSQGEEVK